MIANNPLRPRGGSHSKARVRKVSLLASYRCRLRLNPQTCQIMYRSHRGGDRWISDTPFGFSDATKRLDVIVRALHIAYHKNITTPCIGPGRIQGSCERWFIHLVRPDRGLPVQMCKNEVFGDNLTYTLLSYTGDAVYPNARNSLPRWVTMFPSYWVIKNVATVSQG